MKKISALLTFLILVGIFIPAVSGETYIDESYNLDTYQTTEPIFTQTFYVFRYVTVTDVNKWNNLKTVYLHAPKYRLSNPAFLTMPSDYEAVTLYIGDDNVGNGFVGYNLFYKNDKIDSIQVWLDINEIDFTGYTGKQVIRIDADDGLLLHGGDFYISYDEQVGTDTTEVGFTGEGNKLIWGNHIARGEFYWRNDINFDGESIEITRVFDSLGYHSNFTVDYGSQVYSDISDTNQIIRIFEPVSWTLTNPNGVEYTGTTGDTGTTPSENIITVYVRNSQTNALIADSHIVISASVDNEFYEVINQTLPSGTYTGNLQPTGGGLPNPDFYRLITTAEGYNSIMPYMDFEFDEAVTIYDYLDPIGGAPEDENNTFIDFFVRDMSANPISGATVNFGGYTLITNSAGYTIFEVDKSKTYSWAVSKSGYGSLTGNVVIGDDPRHTINTVLAPTVTPTIPTAIPTLTPISPTPTMTAPTGEPVGNWLEWFAAHFGMILGGGAEIGKIFMWLCFSVPVGVYVGKESKAGAAGFMAGAGIVTLFFVLIGWVPIWLMVLLALIIGLLYAKVFNNSDNGGGR